MTNSLSTTRIFNRFSMLSLLLLISALNSCAPGSNNIAPEISVSKKLVDEVMSLPKTLVPLAYNKLNSAEKVHFWSTHIDNYLAQHDLTENVVKHILQLKTFLRKEMYDNLETVETKKLVANFEKKWFLEPLESKSIPFDVLYEVGTINGVGSNVQNLETLRTSAVMATNCDCYYSLYCPGKETCQSNGCTKVTGCGILGTSNCDGVCAL